MPGPPPGPSHDGPITTTVAAVPTQRMIASGALALPRGPESNGPPMPRQRNTPSPGAEEVQGQASATPAFVRPITATDGTIGGKARSLARLAALGLPVPPAFAISAAAFEALRASGPPLPAALDSALDLAQLEAAQAALLTAPAPTALDHAWRAAVDQLVATTPALPPTDGFAVRSSGATEDHAGVLAPGVFTSQVRIPAPAVGAAIRQVLASYLEPAAWVYAGAAGTGVTAGGVLIHPFVVGTSFGACACDAGSAGGDDAVLVVPSPEASAPPTPTAHAEIRRAARVAAAAHGPCELEWVSDGDRVLFLQLRPYRPPAVAAETAAVDWSAAAGWIWDAAHNPSALSPAQAGLVEWVDARCRIGIRQRVFGGYLHYRPDGAATPSPAAGGLPGPRAVFEGVRAAIDQRLAQLGGKAPLGAVLEAYVDGYQGLYGQVGPVLTRARRALLDFLRAHARVQGPQAATAAGALLAGVPSIAVERRDAARAIASATSAGDRQAAIEAYLQRFGDESGSWDVIDPTFAEDPRRLLLLGQVGAGGQRASIATAPPPPAPPASSWSNGWPQLSPHEEARFRSTLAAARAAASVGEDDDAVFARLQATVRQALLRLGGQLVARGALDDPADVFFLPLDLSVTLDTAADAPAPLPQLRALVTANRDAWVAARRAPPVTPRDAGTTAARGGVIRGLPGAPGRVVGRAVHHPSPAPLGPDAVLIASTLLPTELPLLAPAALVVQTGTVLGHVAAQARERNLPAVVSATHAHTIPEGSLVLVDGHRGEVVLLRP